MTWWLGAWLGCVDLGSDAGRTAWLTDALVDDNRPWLSRDPTLLGTKYEEMSEDPYDFMRGTTSVFYRDLERAGSDRAPTVFLRRPAAALMLIVGDPHPENVGTLLPDDPVPPDAAPELLLEINDFDAAGFGPYLLDVRRALLGLATLLDGAGCGADCREPILEAEVEGWFDEISAIDAGEPTFSAALVEGGDPVLDLLVRPALAEGRLGLLLDDTTTETAGGRRFRTDHQLDDDGDGILPATARERAQALRLLDRYDAPDGFRVHDIARRYGVGIASLPAVRYVVAWDRGDDGPEDDALLQLREVVDPPALPSLPRWTPTLFDGNDHRSVAAAEILWSRPDADPRLGSVTDGPVTFKVQTWSSYATSQDHDRIADAIRDEEVDESALVGWSAHLGRQLAAVHGRSVTADLAPAAPEIALDLGGRRERFVRERTDEVERDLRRLLADHRRFEDALDALGPLLGADELGP